MIPLADILIIEKILRTIKKGSGFRNKKIHVGGTIFTIPVLIKATVELRKLLGGNEPKTGNGVLNSSSIEAYMKAYNKLKKIYNSKKIGRGIRIHLGGFVFTIPLLLSALAATGALMGELQEL
jgi:hypothetical protein